MQRRRLHSKPTRSVSDNIASGVRAHPITPPLINHFRIMAIRRERRARMNSHRAPYSWRGLRLFLRAQASLPACFDRSVFWLIVTTFLLTTSPTFFAQTNNNTAGPWTTSPTAAIRMWAYCCRSIALSWGVGSASECASHRRSSAGKAQRAAWRPSRLSPSAGRYEACEVNRASAPPVN